jgi:hypothetical protein
VEQQGLKLQHKNEADENQGDRIPGQAEDEFSDEDQMVAVIHFNNIMSNPSYLYEFHLP